jgi:hypothetical protein
MDKSSQEALKNLNRYGNSFGAAPRARPNWTRQLQFSIKDARQEPVQYLWFVGDYASYHPRVAAATCAAARVFHRAGLDFGILYEGECNSGNDARLAGEEGLFEALRDKNLRSFAKAHFDEVVTTDPHSFHVLKHEYRATNGARTVRHHTQLLSRDAAKPYLRRGRPHLDGSPAGLHGESGAHQGARGGVAQRGSDFGGGLPEGPGDVPGRHRDNGTGRPARSERTIGTGGASYGVTGASIGQDLFQDEEIYEETEGILA